MTIVVSIVLLRDRARMPEIRLLTELKSKRHDFDLHPSNLWVRLNHVFSTEIR